MSFGGWRSEEELEEQHQLLAFYKKEKERKEQIASLITTPSYNLTISADAKTIKNIQFNLQEMKGNGNCGFEALNISRDEFVTTLLRGLASYPGDRFFFRGRNTRYFYQR